MRLGPDLALHGLAYLGLRGFGDLDGCGGRDLELADGDGAGEDLGVGDGVGSGFGDAEGVLDADAEGFLDAEADLEAEPDVEAGPDGGFEPLWPGLAPVQGSGDTGPGAGPAPPPRGVWPVPGLAARDGFCWDGQNRNGECETPIRPSTTMTRTPSSAALAIRPVSRTIQRRLRRLTAGEGAAPGGRP